MIYYRNRKGTDSILSKVPSPFITNVGKKTNGFNREDDSPHIFLTVCADNLLTNIYAYPTMLSMNNGYKHTKTTVSLINYHFVFCPRYRRKIFNIPGVEQRFKELVIAECSKCGIEILAMECHIDHVHMFLSVLPTMSIPNIMKQIKGATSFVLREEFEQLKAMPSLWTRSYFVSTAGNVSSETIKWYVDTQKTRP